MNYDAHGECLFMPAQWVGFPVRCVKACPM